MRGGRHSLFVSKTHANIFDLQIVVDTMVAALPAETRLLHSPEGSVRGRRRPLIDANDSIVQLLRQFPWALQVSSARIRR